MCLSVWTARTWLSNKKHVAIPTGLLFVVLSALVYKCNLQSEWIGFAMGFIACFSVIVLVMSAFYAGRQSVIFDFLAKYTMPIFLMHTLFAAPLRAVLLKLGVQNVFLHVTLGIVISFVGPILVAVIMKRSKWLEFFLYPGKFIKIS